MKRMKDPILALFEYTKRTSNFVTFALVALLAFGIMLFWAYTELDCRIKSLETALKTIVNTVEVVDDLE